MVEAIEASGGSFPEGMAAAELAVRGDALEPEQPAPANADAYERIAAFAGRSV